VLNYNIQLIIHISTYFLIVEPKGSTMLRSTSATSTSQVHACHVDGRKYEVQR